MRYRSLACCHRDDETRPAALCGAGTFPPPDFVAAEIPAERNVEIAIPDLGEWTGRQTVLIDDIASSGRTLIETARAHLGWRRTANGVEVPPECDGDDETRGLFLDGNARRVFAL